MNEQLYTYSLPVLAVALFAFGLIQSFLQSPEVFKSASFRKAKLAMAFTSLFFGAVNVFEFLERLRSTETEDSLLITFGTLIIASLQAFLFTFSMLALLSNSFQKRQIRIETATITLFTVCAIMVYLFAESIVSIVFTYVYTAFYFSQLIRYTLIFTKRYKRALNGLDNYYSGREADRMRWIRVSFFSALGVGITALALALLPYPLFGFCCSFACLAFYGYFTIRFINYAFVFHDIEKVLEAENENSAVGAEMENGTHKTDGAGHKVNVRLTEKWLDEKQFLQPGITIDDVAKFVGTNCRYLSAYINTDKGTTFRRWINELRLKEAQNLLRQNPSITWNELAEHLGYADKSTLFRQIHTQSGSSPRVWKDKILNS
ncbi:MAG: AraC family transcriptional regulator [Cytophagaceae bacterium]|jgi:AraC-like DNA-binding protein|nr:AraC family transcriptional regulator [Cytophagaceae bacterium]